MVSICRKTIVLFFLLLAGSPHAWAKDYVFFEPIYGEFIVGFDGRWIEKDAGSSQDLEFEEKLRLNLNGAIVDPRLVYFRVRLSPSLKQQQDSLSADGETNESALVTYNASVSLFNRAKTIPFGVDSEFSHTVAEQSAPLGARSDFTSSTRGATLYTKYRPFPISLQIRERDLEESFIPGLGEPTRKRDNLHRTVTLFGRSSKMDLKLEETILDDRTASDQDYEGREARLNNHIGWGKGSRFTSRLRYYERAGYLPREETLASETLRLQHTPNLFTEYGYGYTKRKRINTVETRTTTFELGHRLYENLTTNLRYKQQSTRALVYNEDDVTGNLDVRYRKKLRPDLGIFLNIGGGYRSDDRVGGEVDVTDTPTVPATGIITLSQLYAIWTTIVVTAPGCDPCLEGADYTVSDAGGDQTQLSFPVGSRINIGDTVTVDYTYQAPTVDLYAIPYRAGFRVEYRNFAFHHETTGEDQSLREGPDPDVIVDRRVDQTGVSWKWQATDQRINVSALRTFTDVRDQTSTEYELRQSMTYGFMKNAVLDARLTETFLRSGTRVDAYRLDTKVIWRPEAGLLVTPRLSGFYRDSSSGTTDTFLNTGLDLRWYWRRLTVDMKYDNMIRESGNSSTTENRLMLNLKRKF